MSKTEVSGKQLKDGSVELVDLAPEVSGALSTLQSDVATLQTDVAAKADAGNLATVATSGSYDDLTNKPSIPSVEGLATEGYVDSAVAGKADSSSLATVATSGSYDDLTNKPSIPSIEGLATESFVTSAVSGKADSSSLATVATSGSYIDLTNKPSLFDGAYSSLTGAPTLATVATSGSYNDLSDKPSIPSISGLATETYVDTKVADLVASAPEVLNTLNELASALGDDANFATTVSTNIGNVASDVSALDTRVTTVEGDIATLQSVGVSNLSDLGEVSITTPSSGQVLKYDGLGWVNAADSTFSGVYADLTDKPTLFDGAYSSLTGTPSLFSGSYIDLTNKPTLFDGAYASLTGTPSLATVATSGSYNDLTNKPVASASDLDGLSDVVITSAAKGHFIAHNGTNFVNTRTLEANAAATTPLSLKGAASQSAPIFEVLNSAGTQTMRIAQDGKMRILQPTGASGTYINVSNQWDESIFSVSNDSTGGWISIGTQIYFTSTFGFNKTHRCFGIVPSQERLFFTESLDNGAGRYTLAIDRDTGKSCWAFSVGGTGHGFNFVTANGSAGVGIDLTAAPAAKFQVNSTAAARKGMIVKGAVSQTANLFEAQNNTGTALFSITPTGNATINGIAVGTLEVSTATVFAADTATALTGADNTFIGYQAGKGTTSGYANVVVGSQAYNNGSSATGYQNICIGTYAGGAANTKLQMIIIGTAANARGGRTLGIAIGHVAEAGTRAVALGQGAIADDNTLEIKWGGSSSPTFAGKITGDTAGAVSVTGDFNAKRYTETVANAFNTALAPSSGTLTVDTSTGNAVLGALSAAVTTWAFTNVPTDNSKVTTVTAVIAGNASFTYGDACSVNGSAVSGGILWSGGSAPTATANTDIITFVIVKDSAGTVKVFGSATTNFS